METKKYWNQIIWYSPKKTIDKPSQTPPPHLPTYSTSTYSLTVIYQSPSHPSAPPPNKLLPPTFGVSGKFLGIKYLRHTESQKTVGENIAGKYWGDHDLFFDVDQVLEEYIG